MVTPVKIEQIKALSETMKLELPAAVPRLTRAFYEELEVGVLQAEMPKVAPSFEVVKSAVSDLATQPECVVCGRQYEQTLETLDHCARCRDGMAKAGNILPNADTDTVYAHCRRSGEIVVSSKDYEPDALFLVEAERAELKRVLPMVSRLAHDSVTWLVPGVPETNDQDAALRAVWAFQDALAKRLHVAGGEKRP